MWNWWRDKVLPTIIAAGIIGLVGIGYTTLNEVRDGKQALKQFGDTMGKVQADGDSIRQIVIDHEKRIYLIEHKGDK